MFNLFLCATPSQLDSVMLLPLCFVFCHFSTTCNFNGKVQCSFSLTLYQRPSLFYPFYCVVSSSYIEGPMHQLMGRSRGGGGAVVLVKSGRARPRLGASSASASSSPALTSLHPLSGRERDELAGATGPFHYLHALF